MALAAHAKERLAAAARARFRQGNVQGVCRARRTERPRRRRAARGAGVHPGYALGRDYEGLDDALLVAVTEKRTPADIDRLAQVLEVRVTKLIYERSQPGRRASSLPRTTCPSPRSRRARPRQPPRLPEVAEPELVRHFTELSTRNFGIDTGFYPLGSCTMKHNPRVNEARGRHPRLPRPATRSRRRRARRARSS
jgi:hypothetical protein